MGRDARGYISYGTSGWMSCQIMRADRPALASGNWSDGTPEELLAAVSGYLSYAGTFDVDGARSRVTHRVAMHLSPNAAKGA